MSPNLLQLKHYIVENFRTITEINWIHCNVTFEFLPFVNKGRSGTPLFYDKSSEILFYFPKYSDDFEELLYIFVVEYNQKSTFNQIIFKCKNHDFENATIELVFNKQIDDDFQNSLPKSKRGKIIPWYVSEKLERVLNVNGMK